MYTEITYNTCANRMKKTPGPRGEVSKRQGGSNHASDSGIRTDQDLRDFRLLGGLGWRQIIQKMRTRTQ